MCVGARHARLAVSGPVTATRPDTSLCPGVPLLDDLEFSGEPADVVRAAYW